MKKFVVLGVAVCAAVASQAASFTWRNFYAVSNSDGVYAGGGTAYLIDGAAGHGGISQSALFDMIKGGEAVSWNTYTFYSATLGTDGKSFTAGAATPTGNITVNNENGVITISEPIWSPATYTTVSPSGSTEMWKTYSAIPGSDAYLNSGDFYSVLVTGDGNYYFSEVTSVSVSGEGTTEINFNNATKGAFVDNAGGGWYKAVPEPTSGLLMLVGLGLLGLRRKPRA